MQHRLKTWWLLNDPTASLIVVAAGAWATLGLASNRSTVLGSCEACHLPRAAIVADNFKDFATFTATRMTQSACAPCHLNNAMAAHDESKSSWLPLSSDAAARIRTFHPFVDIPPLMFNRVRGTSRYSRCGLEQFLAHPVPRRLGAMAAMFPVVAAVRRQLLKDVTLELEPCSDAFSIEDIKAGKRLFQDLGCHGCHGQRAEAPLLRIAIPLLSRSFFAARVRGGSTSPALTGQSLWPQWDRFDGTFRRSDAAINLAMPSFTQLSETEIAELYAYVSTDGTDLGQEKNDLVGPKVSWLTSRQLYQRVRDGVFSASCRHCHSADANLQKIISDTFGHETSHISRVQFPAKGVPVMPSADLTRLLSPGPTCSDSLVLQRLKHRHAEWAGKGPTSTVRGMPLTLAPVPTSLIALTEVWTKMGCPSEGGALCHACP